MGDKLKLLKNLYCYIWPGRGNNCNTYLFADVLDGDRPHIVVDPGHLVNEFRERCFDQLLISMEKDGLKPEDVGLIINTHSHPDHCEASKALVERTRAKVGAGRLKQALIAFHEDEIEYRREMANKLGRRLDLEPDLCLREGDLNLGKENKINLKVLHTPGHSPGSISIYWPEDRVLITGDVVFYGAIGRTDLPGGDGKLLKQSIERMSELDVEYLLPGHSAPLGSIIEGREKVMRNFTFIEMNYFPML